MEVQQKNTWQSPFFIIGRGRSGTTLLSRLLSAHSKLTVAPEGFFALNLYPKYRSVNWTSQTIDAFCKDLVSENRMNTWNLRIDEVREQLHACKNCLTYEFACRLVYQTYAKANNPNALWVGDKNPHYALFTEQLLKIFPSSPVIYLARDYRDNILSYQQVPFDLQDTAALAYRWKLYNQAIEKTRKNYPEQFHFLPFEQLLQAPEKHLSEICSFLGIPYEPEMLNFHQQEIQGFYGKDSPWFAKIVEPLDPGQTKKWEKIPYEKLELAENVCRDTGKTLGYQPITNVNPGFKQRLQKLIGFIKARGLTQAEKLLFYHFPLWLKTLLINKYRSRTGRI